MRRLAGKLLFAISLISLPALAEKFYFEVGKFVGNHAQLEEVFRTIEEQVGIENLPKLITHHPNESHFYGFNHSYHESDYDVVLQVAVEARNFNSARRRAQKLRESIYEDRIRSTRNKPVVPIADPGPSQLQKLYQIMQSDNARAVLAQNDRIHADYSGGRVPQICHSLLSRAAPRRLRAKTPDAELSVSR